MDGNHLAVLRAACVDDTLESVELRLKCALAPRCEVEAHLTHEARLLDELAREFDLLSAAAPVCHPPGVQAYACAHVGEACKCLARRKVTLRCDGVGERRHAMHLGELGQGGHVGRKVQVAVHIGQCEAVAEYFSGKRLGERGSLGGIVFCAPVGLRLSLGLFPPQRCGAALMRTQPQGPAEPRDAHGTSMLQCGRFLLMPACLFHLPTRPCSRWCRRPRPDCPHRQRLPDRASWRAGVRRSQRARVRRARP